MAAPKPAPKPTAPLNSAPASGGSAPWSNAQSSAYDALLSTLTEWGMGSLAPQLKKLITGGITDGAQLQLALRETDEWKQRFAGNELRRQLGLPELNPAQYIDLEANYNHLMRAYGLPPGFYDSHDDFAKMIGNDMSPDELNSRLKVYHDQYENAPAEVKALASEYFGKGDVLAALIDPTKAEQVIADKATQFGIAGEAAKQGFRIDQGRASAFQQHGVTIDQAQRAYQQIGQVFKTDQNIASRFGQQFGQADEESDLLLGNGDAANKRQSLYSNERALFGGSAGVDQNALGVSQSF